MANVFLGGFWELLHITTYTRITLKMKNIIFISSDKMRMKYNLHRCNRVAVVHVHLRISYRRVCARPLTHRRYCSLALGHRWAVHPVLFLVVVFNGHVCVYLKHNKILNIQIWTGFLCYICNGEPECWIGLNRYFNHQATENRLKVARQILRCIYY